MLLKKINILFYNVNSQYLKSTKLDFFPIKSSYFNFFEKIVITSVEDYNFYDCNYYFGLFSGCHKFYFKILFKEKRIPKNKNQIFLLLMRIFNLFNEVKHKFNY